MSSRPASLARAALLTAIAGLAIGGCGSSAEEQAQARKQAAEQKRLKAKAAELEGEIKQLKAQQRQIAGAQTRQGTTGGPATTQAPGGTPAGPSRDCGGGVAAGPDTSCAFALNTAKEWVDTSGGTTLQVYSPATKLSYTMKCSTGGQGTTCKGGKGAIVYIP